MSDKAHSPAPDAGPTIQKGKVTPRRPTNAAVRPREYLTPDEVDRLLETVEDLEARQIGLRSLTEAIDTTSAGGRLIFQIFGALAEFERQVIRERTMAGLAAARSRGRRGGRPPALAARDIAAAMAMLRDPAITVAEVARRLNVAASTLYRHLPKARTAALEG